MVNYNKGESRADQLLKANAMAAPEISNDTYKSVSDTRRLSLDEEYSQGLFREKGSGLFREASENIQNKETFAGFAVGSSEGKRVKQADSANLSNSSATLLSSTSGGWRGSGGTTVQMPEIYSPLWLNSNLNLPRDRATVNAWCRSFFALNPIVQNAISLHSTYPIAKLNIKSKNPAVERFFSQMIEEIDLMNICVQIAQEYWTLGEAFVYGELDENTGKWSRLLIQNPDYISVKRSVVAGEPMISLRPDQNLKNIVNSSKPSDLMQRKLLDPSIIEHVRKGENIPLNNFYVSHIARRISPYEVRGTGLIVSCFRSLMLLDKLKESKYVQADSMVNPLSLIKIGDDKFKPTPADLQNFRNLFEQATYDKNFKVFTHNAVTVERVGYGQGIYDISGDIQQAIKEIYIGLMVPSVIMDGSDTTYATGSVALDVLRQRYMFFRNLLSSWLRKKVFAPISRIQGFYDTVDGEKRLIVPEVDWNHMSLFDMNDYIGSISGLATGEGSAKKISLQTLYRSLGVEYEDERKKIRYEDIQEEIRKQELLALQKTPLNKLRSMGPNDIIDPVEDVPVPGESPYIDSVPGQQPASGGPPGLGGLGLPPLPGSPPSAPIGGGGMSKPRTMPKAPPSGPPPPA